MQTWFAITDHSNRKKYRTKLMIRRDTLDYKNNIASLAANMLEIKLIINITISNAHIEAQFMGTDINDIFFRHRSHQVKRNTCAHTSDISTKICTEYTTLKNSLVLKDMCTARL